MRNERHTRERKLYRSPNGIILGVCAGIADYFDMAPWGIRVIFILLMFTGITIPFLIILYIVLGLTIKMRPDAYDAGDRRGATSSQGAPYPREEAVGRLRQRFESLDERLQRLETIVTNPSFGLEDEYRNL